jgi:DNA-binding XRE family transcriptional regulator
VLDQKASDVSELTGMPGTAHVHRHEPRSPSARRHVESERLIFAARMRAARAVLGWSQTELGKKAHVTQRAIYRLEKAAVQARRLTQARIDKAFEDAGIGFAQLPNGGFEMIVQTQIVDGSRRKSGPQS